MGHKERELINSALLEGSKKGRLFRANSGMGWTGKVGFKGPGRIMLLNPRPFHGMPEGFPDIIGWESQNLCMIIENAIKKRPCERFDKNGDCLSCPLHKKIAIFKAMEVKTGKLKLEPEQENFKRILLEQGGIYEERRE